ncbi:MAG: Gfo/Idh/MocA family oxidoreductase [Chloroflexi bacterium]|nr:Gfo/Idh/MocA family oxidoreductase [Chloroflexota bacterium]MCH7656175.1 Gfo/Idh/MocA family oxidoreductase [Chloroflexota bacterium]
MTAAQPPLRLGIIGIGVGATQILPMIEAAPEIDLVAAADINPRVREAFAARYPEARVYDSAEGLCADQNVEAVWVATPNDFHAEHTVLAANAGKHVVSEKPMALNMKEAEAMVEAAERNGVKLLCGHTLGFSPPMMAMRRIINSGELGPLQVINNWTYTDWMLQPRQPEELDEARGGGVLYRQGPHQFDTARLLGGGLVRTVRGTTGKWWPQRAGVGYYSAFLEFEDGVTASIVNNGYGYAMTAELVPWGNDRGLVEKYTGEERIGVRRALNEGTRDEFAAKDRLRIGSEHERRNWRERPKERSPWVPTNMGILIATCERGDIRQSKFGLYVYRDDGVEDRDLGDTQYRAGSEDLMELFNAVRNGAPVYHDGAWGMATLEVITAVMESSRNRKEVRLTHQVAMPLEYDA